MKSTIAKIWNNREIAWQALLVASIIHAIVVGLPLWMILSGIAGMAFWYSTDRRAIALSVALAMVAFVSPGLMAEKPGLDTDISRPAQAVDLNAGGETN